MGAGESGRDSFQGEGKKHTIQRTNVTENRYALLIPSPCKKPSPWCHTAWWGTKIIMQMVPVFTSSFCSYTQWKGLTPENQDNDMGGVRHGGTPIKGDTVLCMHFDLWTLTYEPFMPHTMHDKAVKISLIKMCFQTHCAARCSMYVAIPFGPCCKTIWSTLQSIRFTLQTIQSTLQNYSIQVAKPFNPSCKTIWSEL